MAPALIHGEGIIFSDGETVLFSVVAFLLVSLPGCCAQPVTFTHSGRNGRRAASRAGDDEEYVRSVARQTLHVRLGHPVMSLCVPLEGRNGKGQQRAKPNNGYLQLAAHARHVLSVGSVNSCQHT